MSIDVTNADAYFAAGEHYMSAVWLGFNETTDKLRSAAIASAKRQLTRLLRRVPVEDDTAAGDFPREDIACYEQALYLLRQGFVPNADATTPKWIFGTADEKTTAGAPPTVGICPECRAWIFDSPAPVIMNRG